VTAAEIARATRPVRVGVLGTGQLAHMLELAGRPLGLRLELLAEHTSAADAEAPRGFANAMDVVTYESESWCPANVRRAAGAAPVWPPLAALEQGQDRLHERRFFARLGLPSPRWELVDDARGLGAAVARLGGPCVLKTRRGGYDGKGQWPIRTAADVERAARECAGRPALLEEWVPFRRELSQLSVRARDGEVRHYPLVENHHEKGCLVLTRAPAARVTPALAAEAERMTTALLEELDYVGVLALELFELEPFEFGGRLLANELAPRVHNSGHWTIEGAETSQFENHLRAITGLPLGSTRALGTSVMLNLLGALPPPERVLAVPGAHLHVYGKAPAPRRKLGHVTLRATDEPELARRLAELCARIDLALPDDVRAWILSSSCAST
jgi:5-(carboxyamino)imidazole ribonucleotide synthase